MQQGEEELQASNEHLQAANQQLAANEQELIANEKELKESLQIAEFWSQIVLNANVGIAIGYPTEDWAIATKHMSILQDIHRMN